ncbi:MAG: hypothetical protein KAJ13_09850 [Gemmatimonadetes bacterium]|nr:hypothetical protein [Gemmatimonadota bacterium]
MMKTAVLAVALLMLSGCGSDPTDPLAQFEPQVNNSTDSFQLQATDVTDVGSVLRYSWENTGTQASVDHSTTTAGGAAGLIIKDASGTTVYDQGLAPSLNEDTSSGSTGTWTITVALSEYSGTLNFRVQKK